MPKTPGSKNYKNRPPGSRAQTVSTLLSPLELVALNKLADMQEITRSDVLRRALESYSRSALTFDEYRELYPLPLVRTARVACKGCGSIWNVASALPEIEILAVKMPWCPTCRPDLGNCPPNPAGLVSCLSKVPKA